MASSSYPVTERMVALSTYSLTSVYPNSCPTCAKPLDIHQPDCDNPDKLLAICRRCNAWFVVKLTNHSMLRVPD